MSGHPVPERLHELVESSVGPLGLDVDDLSVTPAGKRRVLRVLVDADESPTLDQVARATRAITRTLDEDDAVMGRQPYTLEVSTRGVDRPLAEPRHWRRNTGRLVAVTFVDEAPKVQGRITATDDEGADLDVDGEQVRVRYADVRAARVQVELNRKDG